MKIKNLLIAAVLLLTANVSQAVMLNIDSSGQLLGASGVEINGSLYDVEFKDGTCIGLFDGCDSNDDFFFHTEADATAASTALMEQVFQGDFDTNPNLVRGCEIFDPNAIWCNAWTHYQLQPAAEAAGLSGYANIVAAHNTAWENGDQVFAPAGDNQTDTSWQSYSTVAVWSNHVDTVPEPGSIALMTLGLTGLGFMRRRKVESLTA